MPQRDMPLFNDLFISCVVGKLEFVGVFEEGICIGA